MNIQNNFRRPLIHCGLPRAGSSYLQTIFSNMDEVFYLHNEFAYLNHADSFYVSDKLQQHNMSQSNKKVVFSHEGLGRSPKLIMLKSMLDNPQILLVTRSPIQWVRSFYCHEVRKGSPLNIKQWLNKNRERIVGALNYDRSFEFYASEFGEENVVFLPFELLTGKNGLFFEQLALHFGFVFKRPEELASKYSFNPSLPMPTIEVIRQFNQVFEMLVTLRNRDVLANSQMGDSDGPFLERFHNEANLLMNDDYTINLQAVKKLTNVFTRLFFQNKDDSNKYLNRLFKVESKGGEWQTLPEIKEICSVIEMNMDTLRTIPVYKSYLADYFLRKIGT